MRLYERISSNLIHYISCSCIHGIATKMSPVQDLCRHHSALFWFVPWTLTDEKEMSRQEIFSIRWSDLRNKCTRIKEIAEGTKSERTVFSLWFQCKFSRWASRQEHVFVQIFGEEINLETCFREIGQIIFGKQGNMLYRSPLTIYKLIYIAVTSTLYVYPHTCKAHLDLQRYMR